ncbi:chlorite dismutase family protein [Xanthobacter sp. VNH20]|uniref:chlorite dismutase family protein n=1 Tax=Xanthobacter sp. VNH20 TaxID=3156616 RepID=UPI0032B47631
MTIPLTYLFTAGRSGPWCIDRLTPVVGEGLPDASHLTIYDAAASLPDPIWVLRGTTSNTRYSQRAEINALTARQEGLGRARATRAALIPIRKTQAWWDLAQDERRAIFEEQSRHIGIGLDYLPAVARRLHHSRELGEPFDFLTWFEYAPEDSDKFEDMVRKLRDTPEWRYVDREVDIRLHRA